jgi:CheY-like chemotaxis protein
MDINKYRALIVDDDRNSRSLFEGQLASLGYVTTTATDGEDAIDILSQDPYFDLIITDVMMPYMSGFDFTARLKELSLTQHIPIIATSAFLDAESARKEKDLIADGFVPKPVEKAILASEIQRVMGKSSFGLGNQGDQR